MKRLDSLDTGLLCCWSWQMQFRLFDLVFVENLVDQMKSDINLYKQLKKHIFLHFLGGTKLKLSFTISFA